MMNIKENIKKRPIVFAVVFGVISGVLSTFYNLLMPGIMFGLMLVWYFYILFSKDRMPFAKKQTNKLHLGKVLLFVLGSTLSLFVAINISSMYFISDEIDIMIASAVGATMVYYLYCWLAPDRGKNAFLFGLFIPLIGAVPSLIFYIPTISFHGSNLSLTILLLFIIWQTLMMITLTWRYRRLI